MKRIVVFGDVRMALETMSRLDRQTSTVVYAAPSENEAVFIADHGFPTAIVDFRDDEALKTVGIGSGVDYLFCFFEADSDNVFLTISARALDKKLNILAIVHDSDSSEKLLAAGADKIIDPYEISGRRTHEVLVKPEITQILDQTVFRRHDLNIAEIEIPVGSRLERCRLSSLRLNERHNLILIGVVDKELGNELHFAVGDKEHVLNAGDVLVVMGPAEEIKEFKEQLISTRKETNASLLNE
ncbi:potassium channel family protein [Methylosarcina fibrata]|uniref:potassium channel family protein n=1 Tax=Methylosarcina fibrata TaxID=105972 RepID=UPI00037AC59C|nr:NAD-binding protein [Methylosarcina fibrata]